MSNLKFSQLLLVGNIDEKEYFEEYFGEVELLENNTEVLEHYKKSIFSTIFLNCDSKKGDVFEICQKIREDDYKKIIVLLTDKMDRDRLLQAIPLHLSGCLERPLERGAVEKILANVENDLIRVSINSIQLKEGYSFHFAQKTLYDGFYQEVKLTKNELSLLLILLRSKDGFVDGDTIEHKIWEEDSFVNDCTNRLKNLLYNLRKKLPKGSISNNYKLGYRLVYSKNKY